MQSLYRVRSSGRSVARAAHRAGVRVIEALEARTFLNAALTTGISTVQAPTGSGPTSLNLNSYFNDPNVTGTLVEMQTSQGNIPINLFDSQVSTTVTNFLHYVNSGEYNNTFFHRVITVGSGGIGIVQGGGYSTNLSPITTASPITLQYQIPNTAGTIAMARTGSPNSATSEWFFNATDNSQSLGASNGGGYAVFGQVLYGGMTAVNAIYNLPQTAVNTTDGQTQSNVPVVNYTSGTVQPSNLVVVQSASVISPLTFGVSTDNNQLVVPSIAADGTLTLSYPAGATGTAHIDVIATDLGGNVASTTFAVNVGGVATTSATIGKGAARIVHFTDPNGVAGTATLAGPGTATLTFTGPGVTTATSKAGVETVSGTPLSISIATTGTSAGSVLNVNGAVTLAGITTDAKIGTILASRATIAGSVSVAGTAGLINLAAANGGAVSVSGTGRALNLRIGSAAGESVSSAGTIASINAGLWTSGGSLSAPTINRIAVSKEFNAQISATNLGLVTAGSITGSTWAVTNKLAAVAAGSITGLNLSAAVIGPITDRGAATNDAITSSGNISAIYAQSMAGTRIEAGVGSADTHGLATAFSTNDRISSVVVGRGGFSNSVIDAQTLPHVSLGATTSTNGGTPFGVASSDIISLVATVDGKRLVLARATSAVSVTAALAKANITPNDFAIRIV